MEEETVDGIRLGVNLWSQATDWPSFLAAGRAALARGAWSTFGPGLRDQSRRA